MENQLLEYGDLIMITDESSPLFKKCGRITEESDDDYTVKFVNGEMECFTKRYLNLRATYLGTPGPLFIEVDEGADENPRDKRLIIL